MHHRAFRTFLWASAASILTASSAQAISDPVERKRELIERVESLRPTEQGRGEHDKWYAIDYGGWSSTTFTDYQNDGQAFSTAAFREDLRWWARLDLDAPDDLEKFLGKDHYIYFRLREELEWARSGRPNRATEDDGPHVDMSYLHSNFGILDFGLLEVNAGRRFFQLGRGLVYADIHDGFDVTLSLLGMAKLTGFWSHTLPHEHNIDTSFPGFDKRYKRIFHGWELEFLRIPQHQPYMLLMVTRDNSVEKGQNTADFRYDAEYYGFGSRGELFLPNLRYWSEWVWQRGESMRTASTNSSPIRAWAVDSSLEYYFRFYGHPVFKFGYAIGSGDPDRTNVTNTTGGNTGGKDENFLYFGHFPGGGYALNGRLSNLQVYKIGFSLRPFESKKLHERLKKKFLASVENITVGGNLYFFRKVKARGGISDLRATDLEREVAEEWDLFANWRITSDLNWSIQWGDLDVGDAYPRFRKKERYLSTNLTFMF